MNRSIKCFSSWVDGWVHSYIKYTNWWPSNLDGNQNSDSLESDAKRRKNVQRTGFANRLDRKKVSPFNSNWYLPSIVPGTLLSPYIHMLILITQCFSMNLLGEKQSLCTHQHRYTRNINNMTSMNVSVSMVSHIVQLAIVLYVGYYGKE